MGNLTEIFENTTTTQNGDFAYKSLNNKLADILFKSEFYTLHPSEVKIGNSLRENLFAMFMRDPRFGMGRRALGRELLKQTCASIEDICKCGRFDDLFEITKDSEEAFNIVCAVIKAEIENGNELAKKWCPRFPTHNRNKVIENGLVKKGDTKLPFNDKQIERLMLAKRIASVWGMNRQTYNKFIKVTTTESKLSQHHEDDINFSQVPSLASLKYAHAFATKKTTRERYAQFIEDAKAGRVKVNASVSTPYDIYKTMKQGASEEKNTFAADLFFEKLPKISINALCVIDTSGSMFDQFDSIGKAMSIGHYITKCSTYCNDKVVTFSEYPHLLTLGDMTNLPTDDYWYNQSFKNIAMTYNSDTTYAKEIASIYSTDWGMTTNLSAVMELLKDLEDTPEYIVVLSDMQFNRGSHATTEELCSKWRAEGINTKIIWWNFASNPTVPQMDNSGNIFLSGYNPQLLKYLQCGFNNDMFIEELLKQYALNIAK